MPGHSPNVGGRSYLLHASNTVSQTLSWMHVRSDLAARQVICYTLRAPPQLLARVAGVEGAKVGPDVAAQGEGLRQGHRSGNVPIAHFNRTAALHNCGPASAPGPTLGPLHTPRTPGTSLAHGQAAPSAALSATYADRHNATSCSHLLRTHARAKRAVFGRGWICKCGKHERASNRGSRTEGADAGMILAANLVKGNGVLPPQPQRMRGACPAQLRAHSRVRRPHVQIRDAGTATEPAAACQES